MTRTKTPKPIIDLCILYAIDAAAPAACPWAAIVAEVSKHHAIKNWMVVRHHLQGLKNGLYIKKTDSIHAEEYLRVSLDDLVDHYSAIRDQDGWETLTLTVNSNHNPDVALQIFTRLN